MDKWESVDSSMVEKIKYDYKNNNLQVKFNNGKEYLYFKVEPHIYRGLITSNSFGKVWHELVKGKYSFAQI